MFIWLESSRCVKNDVQTIDVLRGRNWSEFHLPEALKNVVGEISDTATDDFEARKGYIIQNLEWNAQEMDKYE